MFSCLGVVSPLAQEASPPPTTGYQIPVPPKWRKKGGKLRIRNQVTGQQKVIDIQDQEFISSAAVRDLMDPKTKEFVPEFSVLDYEQGKKRPALAPEANPTAQSLSNSLVFDQPVWRELGYRSKTLPSGEIVFRLDSQGGKVLGNAREVTITNLPMPTPEEASHRRSLVEDRDIKKLFDIGWRSVGAKRYDLGAVAFDRLLSKKAILDPDQFMQANLGMGITRFHQQGCARVEENFKIAQQDPRNLEDISYYRGLCFVEAKRFNDADVLFKQLAKSQSAKYADSSRYFVGIVAENQGDYDAAESAFLDTTDFSTDAHLVSLAKAHLEAVRQAKANRDFSDKWLLLALTGGLGYDSNAIGLPQSVSPAAYQVQNAGSPVFTGLLYSEIRVPGPTLRAKDIKLKITAMDIHYFKGDIAQNFDLQSYEGGAAGTLHPSDRDAVSLGVSYTATYKGVVGSSGEYLASPNFEAKWSQIEGPIESPTSDFQATGKISLIRAVGAPTDQFYGSTANSYGVNLRKNFHVAGEKIFGPGFDFEYRPATGTEVSYYSASILGRLDLPVGPASWKLYANQEGALQFTPYYQSSEHRKDSILKYTGSVARLWQPWLETRLQFIGTLSFSNAPTYQYQKAQINLLVSAFF